MEINTTINISIFISAVLIILGWIVNNILSRKHEIAKKRLEYRLETLHSFIPVVEAIKSLRTTDTSSNLIRESHIKFQLYGTQEENNIFNILIEHGNNNELDKVFIQAEKLIKIVLNEIRNELNLSKLK
jgi:hypothetical protein